MNYNKNLYLALTLIIILNFNSCKKYEENPSFVLIPKNSRLTGEWMVISIDGESVESYFNNLYSGYNYYNSIINFDKVNWIWDFEKDQDLDQELDVILTYSYTNYSGYSYSNTDTVNQSRAFNWEWEDNKSEIEIEQTNYNLTIKNDYKILKLTNSEMKLNDENDVEWEFEKI